MPQTTPPGRYIDSLTEDGRYRLLVEAVTDYAIYMLHADGTIASWNPGAHRLKGYEEAEIIGEHFSRFYTEEDRAKGLPARPSPRPPARVNSRATAGGSARTGAGLGPTSSSIRSATPQATSSGTSKSPATSPSKKPPRRRSGAARTNLGGSSRASPITRSTCSARDGKVASWNAGAQRIKGYTPEEIIGEHFSRFYTEEDRLNGEPERALATAIREGRFEKEGWRVRKNGERFWANVIIDAIREGEGEGEGEVIGFAKITRALPNSGRARRPGSCAEALFQSQKMEAIGQLTGGIAHDFNNLLTAIIGSLEIASRRVSDKSVMRLIDNALRGAQRGAALTQRMLVFARRQKLDVQPVDIPSLVRGMSEMLERSLGPSVLIETRFPLRLPWVKTDPNQLEMAVLNLIVNARDAMPHGGPIVVAARPKRSRRQGPLARLLRLLVSNGHRRGNGRRHAVKSDGPVFHHQGNGEGHRPWAADGARLG